MVAKITFPKSIEAALNYNEKKMQKGSAQCLHAANYLKDAREMNFYQKLNGFKMLNCLNNRATTKTLHVSLNFDPSEKLPVGKLVEIARMYMKRIGFEEQPYLVYKHEDAAHPHIHIVSSTIREDGSRINTHNIGRNQSETARKEIEAKFKLVKAESQQKLLSEKIKPFAMEKALYGISETKQSISNIVTAVFTQYKYSSLPEFNAALKQFNIIADRGKEEGMIYKNRGLVYRILNTKGIKMGVPIKASSIACKPILQNLEQKYIANETAKQALKQLTKNVIDDCLNKKPGSINQLITDLGEKNIYTVLRQNYESSLYGITFVDNQNKCVFNGSDLGKGYSIAALQSRITSSVNQTPSTSKETDSAGTVVLQKEILPGKLLHKTSKMSSQKENILDILLNSKEQHDNVPSNLLKKKRKKKKRKDNNF
jgi:hypothetical protein